MPHSPYIKGWAASLNLHPDVYRSIRARGWLRCSNDGHASLRTAGDAMQMSAVSSIVYVCRTRYAQPSGPWASRRKVEA
eukprot:scaffold258431_cov37-Tisochrysis_lutea.AAC.1